MDKPSLPPGIEGFSDPETATSSRARRRIALAAKLAAEEMTQIFNSKFALLDQKLDVLLASSVQDTESRLSRLETLAVCSPSSDDVLNEMLKRRAHDSHQPDAEPSPLACVRKWCRRRANWAAYLHYLVALQSHGSIYSML